LKVVSLEREWHLGVNEMVAALHCGVAVRDAEHHLVWVNDHLLQWLGYTLDELVGRPVDVLYPPETLEILQKEMKAIEAGDLRARLSVLRRKNGTALPVLILPQPVYDDQLNVLGGVGVIIELATIQTARTAGYTPSEGQLRERLDKIALEIQSIGLVAGAAGPPVPLEHPELAGLSDREKEVLTQLVSGDRVPDIASALHISQNTVRNHLKSIFRKVGVGGQGELIQKVRELTAQAGAVEGVGS
jgi:PAS domain S-box-containing protein